jgi:hypothetical protein
MEERERVEAIKKLTHRVQVLERIVAKLTKGKEGNSAF